MAAKFASGRCLGVFVVALLLWVQAEIQYTNFMASI